MSVVWENGWMHGLARWDDSMSHAHVFRISRFLYTGPDMESLSSIKLQKSGKAGMMESAGTLVHRVQ